MILLAALGFLVGCLLSAFFSGSETGFYRVSRVRLVLDGLGGDQISRSLLWLTNNPSLFVATTLIGNNVANYLTSLAIVLAAREIFSESAFLAEIMGPIIFAPIVFVYGELLPKNMFFQAPNRLLRFIGPPFLLFGLLVSPLSALLWALNRGLQTLFGESPEKVRLTLARKELRRVLQEGHDAGILVPAQKSVAHNLFELTQQTAGRFCIPETRVVRVRIGDRRSEVLRLARRHRATHLPVSEKKSNRLVGYLRVVDLQLHDAPEIVSSLLRPMLPIAHSESLVAALINIRSQQAAIAKVVGEQEQTLGLIYAEDLIDVIFGGE